jgi:3-phenylpropionate/trans-cinnamate dioxygenase ferredoxin reductase subunit
MEYSGHARAGDQVVFRGDPSSREFVAFWLHQGVVVAGMNANVWDVTNPIQQLIRKRAAVDPARLADPNIPLDALLPDRISS